MTDNQHILSQLQELLGWKKSKKFYAEKLGVTEAEVDELMKEIRHSQSISDEAEVANYIGALEDEIVHYKENLKDGLGEVIINCPDEIRTLEELIKKCKIDTSKWEIVKYVQNYWGNKENPYWQVKAWLSKKKEDNLFQQNFIDFLSSYSFHSSEIEPPEVDVDKSDACLVINKQDAHFDKHDVDGENDIESRFADIYQRLYTILAQAKLSNNIEKIIYIIGSDELNSEFTQTTTKGTPQQNIQTYHETFKLVCEFEKNIIKLLLENAERVDVIYVPGNHDEYVGWHLINWLSAFYVDGRINFDCEPKYRKYVSYGETAMMFNHGDAMKPAKLAAIFPMEYRELWSYHGNFYIFTGDKHHELSQDFNGIKFYQIPAFSKAHSKWDEKNGYTSSRGEVTAFLIEKYDGITNIFKQYL
jgi:hypothetical protein